MVSAAAGSASMQAIAAAISRFIITLQFDVRLEPIGQAQYIGMVRRARAVTGPCFGGSNAPQCRARPARRMSGARRYGRRVRTRAGPQRLSDLGARRIRVRLHEGQWRDAPRAGTVLVLDRRARLVAAVRE